MGDAAGRKRCEEVLERSGMSFHRGTQAYSCRVEVPDLATGGEAWGKVVRVQ
jgi:hypothetical protein